MMTLNGHSLNQLAEKDRQMVLVFTHKIQHRFAGQVISVILFGSRARGQAEPDSDMDVLVILAKVDPDIQREVHGLAADVWLEYGTFLSSLVWSQEHWRKVKGLQTSLYQNICRDGIELLDLAAWPAYQ